MSIFFLHSVLFCLVFFFFFQAEDGIRDLTVTGVQTCALPISPLEAVCDPRARAAAGAARRAGVRARDRADAESAARRGGSAALGERVRLVPCHDHPALRDRDRRRRRQPALARVSVPLESTRSGPPPAAPV